MPDRIGGALGRGAQKTVDTLNTMFNSPASPGDRTPFLGKSALQVVAGDDFIPAWQRPGGLDDTMPVSHPAVLSAPRDLADPLRAPSLDEALSTDAMLAKPRAAKKTLSRPMRRR